MRERTHIYMGDGEGFTVHEPIESVEQRIYAYRDECKFMPVKDVCKPTWRIYINPWRWQMLWSLDAPPSIFVTVLAWILTLWAVCRSITLPMTKPSHSYTRTTT